MKVGDLVKVKEDFGYENAGKYAILIRQIYNRDWWCVMFVDGQRGRVVKHTLEVVNESR